MLGDHQLQNAATATCVALCLRNLGITFLPFAWPHSTRVAFLFVEFEEFM